MELVNRVKNFPIANVLKVIFFILLLTNIILATDIIMSIVGIARTPTDDLVPSAEWYYGNDRIFFDIEVNIPNSGFISKGANISYEIEVLDSIVGNDHPILLNWTIYEFGTVLNIYEEYILTTKMRSDFNVDGYLEYEIKMEFQIYYASILFSDIGRQIQLFGHIS